MKDGPRKTACCVICDQPVYEVLTSHPETKQPRRLGEPVKGAGRAVILQVDGRRVELSLCGACRPEFEAHWPELMPKIWQRVILATVAQRNSRSSDPAWIETHDRAIVDLVNNPPIAYVGIKGLEIGVPI